MLKEDYDDALLTFQKVLMRDPANSLARINVGYICLKKKIFGESIEHLSKAIRLDNDRKATLYAHFYLGLVYLEREMFKTRSDAFAVGDLGRLFARGHDLACHDALGLFLFAEQQHDAADRRDQDAEHQGFAEPTQQVLEPEGFRFVVPDLNRPSFEKVSPATSRWWGTSWLWTAAVSGSYVVHAVSVAGVEVMATVLLPMPTLVKLATSVRLALAVTPSTAHPIWTSSSCSTMTRTRTASS